jgi:hypothetical protein
MTNLLLKMPTWMPSVMKLLVRCFTKWMGPLQATGFTCTGQFSGSCKFPVCFFQLLGSWCLTVTGFTIASTSCWSSQFFSVFRFHKLVTLLRKSISLEPTRVSDSWCLVIDKWSKHFLPIESTIMLVLDFFLL